MSEVNKISRNMNLNEMWGGGHSFQYDCPLEEWWKNRFKYFLTKKKEKSF